MRDLRADRHILFVTEDNSILRSQLTPFLWYAGEIRRRHGAAVHQLSLHRFEAWAQRTPRGFDTVVLQPWFDIELDRLRRLLEIASGMARRVVFMDGYAPTDLRLAATVDRHVDHYVKKHVLRDRSSYGKPTRGDTNLTDYYARRYGIELPETVFDVSPDFLRRLIVGPSFFTDAPLWQRLLQPLPTVVQDIDVHARLGVGDSWGWYSQMRRESVAALEPLRGLHVVAEAGVSKSQYLSELERAKICFSPFGFGEIAWRDFEAMAYGSLLLKPDCGHLELEPDILRPFETYVPLRWDFADLEKKVRTYLHDNEQRRRIVERARQVLHDYIRSGAFLDRMAPILRAPS